MEQWFRVSVIGRFRKGIRREDVQALLNVTMEKKRSSSDQAFPWISSPLVHQNQICVKFSAVIPFEKLEDAWSLQATSLFSDAGYGDVTWKITPLAPGDPSGEETTCSIPADWFQIDDVPR